MKINKVTISGADNLVDKEEMLYTQEVFPFVEWGILVSEKRMGTSRYPTLEWISHLAALPAELNLSFHLCGEVARDFVAGGSRWTKIAEDHRWQGSFYQRLQLNFSFKEEIDYIENLFGIAFSAAKLPYNKKSIILAYNKGSKKNLDSFIERITEMPENIHFLNDSSGGRGSEIKAFNKPLKNYTGYAGGINPDNVFSICDTLTNMEWENDIWIDMETGVRTDDKFDMKKVNKVLAQCEKFITP